MTRDTTLLVSAGMHDRRERFLAAKVAPVVVRGGSSHRGGQSSLTGVPHACHDGRRTAVMSSHSKALQMASELGISRSGLAMK
jgi:hypothetical protein